MTALALAGSDLELGGEVETLRSDRVGAQPTVPASTCATQKTAHRQSGRPVHQAQRQVGHRFWLPNVTVPLGRKKTHRSMSLRTQPGLRFRTCCATTTADENVVKRPRVVNFGGGT